MVLAYETLSETHWNVSGVEPSFFNQEFYINVDNTLDKKLEVLSSYKSQLKNNHSRSLEIYQSLAAFRGSQNGCNYAEAFKVVSCHLKKLLLNISKFK